MTIKYPEPFKKVVNPFNRNKSAYKQRMKSGYNLSESDLYVKGYRQAIADIKKLNQEEK